MNASYDLAFGHAVRQAATGLRTAAGSDPEVAAAPLAAILRSAHALDPDGLELLARLVTGNLRKVRQPAGETIMAHAVRRAGTAWRHGKRDDPAITGAALAVALRADPARLGQGERALLADLVTGEWRRGVNRPSKGAGHNRVAAVVEAFRIRVAAGAVRKVAIEDTASEIGINGRTVERYLALTERLERRIQDALK